MFNRLKSSIFLSLFVITFIHKSFAMMSDDQEKDSSEETPSVLHATTQQNDSGDPDTDDEVDDILRRCGLLTPDGPSLFPVATTALETILALRGNPNTSSVILQADEATANRVLSVAKDKEDLRKAASLIKASVFSNKFSIIVSLFASLPYEGLEQIVRAAISLGLSNILSVQYVGRILGPLTPAQRTARLERVQEARLKDTKKTSDWILGALSTPEDEPLPNNK